jgi:hypothetical protein
MASNTCFVVGSFLASWISVLMVDSLSEADSSILRNTIFQNLVVLSKLIDFLT